MQELDAAQQDYLFALDIGTRSVIGVVGRMQRGVFHVADVEYAEHDKRAMFDGQIEDIEQVARVSGIVKERLEARLGIHFDNVCVAAAGRSLRTCHSSFEIELDPESAITSQTVYQLEMGAIGLAQDEVNAARENEDDTGMFCVGYSVTGYYLDGYRMTTILGHRGKLAHADVIATFLPNQVVDSLRSAMSLIDLNIINLTLEPIAAMNAVIPSELRLLNLALVDIGAGTSDIAVSDQGSVVAYTMATTAGDEITEFLMKRFLIDFSTAEQLKSAAGESQETINYTDILNFEYSIATEDLLETLKEPVNALAEEICKRIKESNGGQSPVAVFLVGGGSKVPLLADAVARILGVDISKVAVGGSAYMKKQTSGEFDVTDPEYATPLGIALTASTYAEQNSMCVYVNDHKVQMMRSAGFTVMNALLMCGYKYPQLMGRSGHSVSFELNGESIMVRGGRPRPAEITVNDQPASIATGLSDSDRIIIMPSLSGEDARPVVGEYTATAEEPCVKLDGIPFFVGELAFINGKPVRRDAVIEQGDIVTTRWINSLEQLCEQQGLIVDGLHFTINGQPASLTDLLRDGDVIISEDDDYVFPAVAWQSAEDGEPLAPQSEQTDVAADEPAGTVWATVAEVQAEPATVDAESVFAAQTEPQAANTTSTARETAEPAPATEPDVAAEPEPEPEQKPAVPCMSVVLNRRTVELYAKPDKTPYQFIDMLNLVDIDPTKPEGDIVLRVNGKNASYLQELHQGDDIQIYWSNGDEL